MQPRQFGEVGRLLPDGATLVRETVLDNGQVLAMRADSLLLDRASRQAAWARAINLGGRALAVGLGLVLAHAVIVNGINALAAIVLAVILLFTRDMLTRMDNALTAKREKLTSKLSMTEPLLDFVGSHGEFLSHDERNRRYQTLLRGRDLIFGGVCVRVARGEDGISRLLMTTCTSEKTQASGLWMRRGGGRLDRRPGRD